MARRADSKLQQNDPVSAVKLYRAALEKDPRDYDVRLALADVLTDMRRYTASNHVLIPYMHEDEDFLAEAYYHVGYNFFGLLEYDAARRCFDRFFDLTDEVSERTDAIMDVLDHIESFSSDEPMLADADDFMFKSKLDEARNHMMSNEYEPAMELFTELHAMKPDDNRIRYDLALSCMCCHEYEKGLENIDELIKRDPKDLSALSLKLVYAQNVRDEVMIGSLCNQLEGSEVDMPDELLPVIGVILEAGRTELALCIIKRVVARQPYDPLANHILALCYARMKKFSAAAAIYDKLLCIDPDDPVAAFYRARFTEEKALGQTYKAESLIHYQIPLVNIMESIKAISTIDVSDTDDLRERWLCDKEFQWLLRWAFTVREFGISYAVLNILKMIGDESAQMLMREAIIDPDANATLVHEALGMLKLLNAEEPYFAFVHSTLLEGRVNMLDISDIRIPKQYKLIFPRFHQLAGGLYDIEVYAAASGLMESFLASMKGDMPQLDEARSTALSAALECAACKKCGVPIKDDILERYGITERRLKNAFDRMMMAVLADFFSEEGDET